MDNKELEKQFYDEFVTFEELGAEIEKHPRFVWQWIEKALEEEYKVGYEVGDKHCIMEMQGVAAELGLEKEWERIIEYVMNENRRGD